MLHYYKEGRPGADKVLSTKRRQDGPTSEEPQVTGQGLPDRWQTAKRVRKDIWIRLSTQGRRWEGDQHSKDLFACNEDPRMRNARIPAGPSQPFVIFVSAVFCRVSGYFWEFDYFCCVVGGGE